MEKETIKERFLGTIFGQAVGDALGLSTEFMSKQEVDQFYPNGIEDYSQIIPFIDLAYHEGLDSLCLDDEESMGYTLRTLGAALWAYWHATSYKEGILKIVLSGGDADTNAAVAGAILGAKFGIDQIPEEWRNGLLYASMLHNKVQDFFFYNHSHSRKVTLVSTFGNAKVRFLSEKKEFYSRKVSLMTKIGNRNRLLCGFTFKTSYNSNQKY